MSHLKHLCGAALIATALLAAGPSHALFVLSTGSAETHAGGYADVDILLNATLGDATNGFGLELGFDSTILALDSVTFGSGFDFTTGAVEADPGRWTLDAFSDPFGSGLTGSILLATLRFQGLAEGGSALSVTFPGFNDSNPTRSTDGIFQPIPPGVPTLPDQNQDGQVTVAAPVAPTLLLLLPGVFSLLRCPARPR